MGSALDRLVEEIVACRICAEQPRGKALPHAPRPVLRVSGTARLAVCGQAPGVRVHASGIPFTDPSGERLRAWMGVSSEEFYDQRRVAIVPMGFCFPGLDEKGGDLPPRRECAPAWRNRLFQLLPRLELILLVGGYAQRWHLEAEAGHGLSETVERWEHYLSMPRSHRLLPLPHPSWRNNRWLADHPWFERDLLPRLKREVRAVLDRI